MNVRRSLRIPRRALSGLVGLCTLALALTGVLPGAPAAAASGAGPAGPPVVTRQAGPDNSTNDDSVPAWVWAVVGASGGGALTFAFGYKLWLTRRARRAPSAAASPDSLAD